MKIVQVGANCGHDDLSHYVHSKFNSNPQDVELYLIEPNPKVLDSLKQSYRGFPNAFIYNFAIKSPFQEESEIEIFYYEDDVIWEHDRYGKASMKMSHLEKHKGMQGCRTSIKSFVSECLTLDKFLTWNNLFNLDWLYIDAEGMDAEILLTFDWKKYSIKKIEFEHLHLGYYADPIKYMLRGLGYVPVESTNEWNWAFEKFW